MFDTFFSNTSAPTGGNYIIKSTNGRKLFRIYIKPEKYGKFNWRFFFMNKMNSTFAQGEESYRNMECGQWTIHMASISHSDTIEPNEKVFGTKKVLFDGNESKHVSTDEVFWSDPLEYEINSGFLVWDWEVEGEKIPSMPDEIYSTFEYRNGEFVKEGNVPVPAMFGCDKKVKKKVGFIGDSITAGCQTPKDKYEMWVGRISTMLKDDYAVWNLGLGYARGSDFATFGSWFEKAKHNDVIIMTFGVNDLCSGTYGAGRGSKASEIIADDEKIIRALQECGIEVIISTIPPFHYSNEQKMEWRCANLAIHHLAKMYNCRVYDIESSLDIGELNNERPFGDHPDSRGGEAAANKFKETFCINGEWNL